MRKNHLAKLVRYMKNVYHLERCLNKLSDERVNPTYSTGQIILPVLFGFLLRVKSFNELSFMIKNHEFSQLFARLKWSQNTNMLFCVNDNLTGSSVFRFIFQ